MCIRDSAYPNPKCSLGIGSSQSYAPAATVMFLSELSKLVEQDVYKRQL